MKKVSVCINLDTLALGSGWKLPSSGDPTYRLVDERLISRLEKAGFKATLFVIGRDLESPENREFARKWSQAGHEIGNHSYSHPLNLASLTRRQIEDEIGKTDSLIKETTGKKPVGFNAPGWAVAKNIDVVLASMNYQYDLSPFLSWWIYPLLLKQWWSLRREEISSTVWRRHDIFYPLIYKLWSAKASQKISRIPLPTTGPTSIPIWHTGWFIFGEKIFPKLLKSAIKENPEFYYLMHPADVMDIGDIPNKFAGKINFERLDVPIKQKMKFLNKTLEELSGFEFVTAGRLVNP